MTDAHPASTHENVQEFSFKAETKQLLNILIHSLYKDREVFLRELLSNASDALNRMRFEMVTNQNVLDPKVELSIHIKADKEARTLTIEDTGIALGEAFAKALGDKRGIERYGFALPMDDAEAKVLLDFGGRNWIVWNASFSREKIGDMPTEMFFHFFKSFSDSAKCNLNVECKGQNEHHKIEAIFKAFAKAIKMAVKRDASNMQLPSTKGLL